MRIATDNEFYINNDGTIMAKNRLKDLTTDNDKPESIKLYIEAAIKFNNGNIGFIGVPVHDEAIVSIDTLVERAIFIVFNGEASIIKTIKLSKSTNNGMRYDFDDYNSNCFIDSNKIVSFSLVDYNLERNKLSFKKPETVELPKIKVLANEIFDTHDEVIKKSSSVKWDATKTNVEIPSATPLNVSISPEEAKDIADLYQETSESKMMNAIINVNKKFHLECKKPMTRDLAICFKESIRKDLRYIAKNHANLNAYYSSLIDNNLSKNDRPISKQIMELLNKYCGIPYLIIVKKGKYTIVHTYHWHK